MNTIHYFFKIVQKKMKSHFILDELFENWRAPLPFYLYRFRRIFQFSDVLLLLFTRVLDEFALDEVFLEPIIRLKQGIAVQLQSRNARN